MHRTNGCTMAYWQNRQPHVCANHERMTRETVESYQKPGQVFRKLKALSDATGPRGVWMRDAGWRAQTSKPKTRLQAGLNACAHRAITYDMETVMVRKAEK